MQYHFLSSPISPRDSPKQPDRNNPFLLSQIISLYRDEGWWNDHTDSESLLRKLIDNSHCFLVAMTDGQEVAGMGRAISDRTSDAYIQDVAVRKDFRKTGIGTAIILQIIKRLQTDGITWIGLISEKASHPFYEKIGFTRFPDAIPMIFPTPKTANHDI